MEADKSLSLVYRGPGHTGLQESSIAARQTRLNSVKTRGGSLRLHKRQHEAVVFVALFVDVEVARVLRLAQHVPFFG